MTSLADLFAEEEAKNVAKVRAEMAEEKAAWDALTDAERADLIAANAAKWEARFAGCDDEPEEDEDEEADEGADGE